MSAISFKTLTQDDITTSRTLLHEAIPITGTLVSGTYATSSHSDGIDREANIKTFSHGMFQSIYDYPYASSSANHIFDLSFGYASGSTYFDSSTTSQHAKKRNIYNQMAQILAGYDTDGNIRKFDFDGDFSTSAGTTNELGFLTFSRLLVKDEIKKGSFTLTVGTADDLTDSFSSTELITDSGSTTNYRANSPAGEYGFLYNESGDQRGLIYYQAGIVCLDYKMFPGTAQIASASWSEDDAFVSGTIDRLSDGWRNRIKNISFNNTTELNSTIYFCRAHKGEFNYSSNPTYLSGSKIRVKTDPGTNEYQNPPMSYVTTVGLYSPDNVLLAVAKLSEPVKKTPINELNLRVRLDY